MDDMTRGSIAKLLVKTEFLDGFINEAIARIEQEVLNASDARLLDARKELTGAKNFSSQLKQIINEHMMRENPHLQDRYITP